MIRLTKPRALALGLLGASGVLAILAIIAPLGSAISAMGSAGAQGELLELTERRAAAIRQERQFAETLGRSAATTGLYVQGDTAGTAGAALQTLLARLVKKSGGQVLSLRVVENSNELTPQRVALDASIQIDIDGLKKFLHQVETRMPLLIVEHLTGKPVEEQGQNGGSRGELAVSLLVSGLWNAGAGS